MRKIIQISSYTNALGEGMFALCNDGTLWRLSSMYGWLLVDNIPQDEISETPNETNKTPEAA